MDISNETDLNKLKAMAYDESVIIGQSQSNLNILNDRIRQIMESQLPDKGTDAKDE